MKKTRRPGATRAAGTASSRKAPAASARRLREAPAAGATLNRRKVGHVDACLNDAVDRQQDSFAAWKLRYRALPELSLAEISTETEFAGRKIAAPIIISCMTGGVGKRFQRINRNLAIGAEALRIPLGLGSMKVMLSHEEAAASFEVRDCAPNVALIANLGLVSFNHGLTLNDVNQVIARNRPDVMGLHLNALQEAVQDGGDTDFRGLTGKLQTLVQECPLPVYVKECGGGIAPDLVERIAGLGARYIDVSGNDGTSWASVEASLSPDPGFGERFRDFGLPTAWILEHLPPRLPGVAQVVASGGIRTGIQAAKALALGARYVSVARPFLLAAEQSAELVVELGERLIRELRTAMFLSGAATLNDLRRESLIDVRGNP